MVGEKQYNVLLMCHPKRFEVYIKFSMNKNIHSVINNCSYYYYNENYDQSCFMYTCMKCGHGNCCLVTKTNLQRLLMKTLTENQPAGRLRWQLYRHQNQVLWANSLHILKHVIKETQVKQLDPYRSCWIGNLKELKCRGHHRITWKETIWERSFNCGEDRRQSENNGHWQESQDVFYYASEGVIGTDDDQE